MIAFEGINRTLGRHVEGLEMRIQEYEKDPGVPEEFLESCRDDLRRTKLWKKQTQERVDTARRLIAERKQRISSRNEELAKPELELGSTTRATDHAEARIDQDLQELDFIERFEDDLVIVERRQYNPRARRASSRTPVTLASVFNHSIGREQA